MADVIVRYKGNTIAEMNESGGKTLKTSGKYCEDDIGIEYVKSGGGAIVSKPELWEGVNFIDYEGTIIETWTPEETASKTELPTPPTHEYLVNDGWNWTLQEIKDYMIECPNAYLNVGARYNTKDWDAYLFVELDKFTLNPTISFSVKGTASIDWGDGTTSEVNGTSTKPADRVDTSHIYAQSGSYVIKIKFVYGYERKISIYEIREDDIYFPSIFWSGIDYNSSIKYLNALKSAFFGTVSVETRAFTNAYGLETVVLGTSTFFVPSATCFSNTKIDTLVIPSCGGSRIDDFIDNPFTKISIPAYCNGVILSGGNCRVRALAIPVKASVLNLGGVSHKWLSKITIPKNSSLTSLVMAFQNAQALLSVNVPSKVTNIGVNCFSECTSLEEIHFYPTIPPTVTNSNAFSGLPTTCKIYVPKDVLTDYRQATNYPDPSVYTYIEE